MTRALRPWTCTGDFSPQSYTRNDATFISRDIVFQNFLYDTRNITLIRLTNLDNSRNFSLLVEFRSPWSYSYAIEQIGTRGNANYARPFPFYTRQFDFTGDTNDFIDALTHLANIENDVNVIKNLLIEHVRNLRGENTHTTDANLESNPEIYFLALTFRFQAMLLSAISFLMANAIHVSSNHRRLVTASPNNERRLIVRSTENRMVLRQTNVAHHLSSALLSVMQLIGSLISATGMGRMGSLDYLLVINAFSSGMPLFTSILPRAHVDLRAHHIADFFELRGNNPFYWPESPGLMIFDFDDQPNLGALTTMGTFLSVERPIPLPQTGKNAKALSEIAGFDTSNTPDEFCCHLSGDIMDNPVIDPTTLNAAALTWISAPESEKETLDRGNFDEVPRFERIWLERAISERDGNSPMTRQQIVTPLISDSTMKKQIEDFVRSQISTTAPTYSF